MLPLVVAPRQTALPGALYIINSYCPYAPLDDISVRLWFGQFSYKNCNSQIYVSLRMKSDFFVRPIQVEENTFQILGFSEESNKTSLIFPVLCSFSFFKPIVKERFYCGKKIAIDCRQLRGQLKDLTRSFYRRREVPNVNCPWTSLIHQSSSSNA